MRVERQTRQTVTFEGRTANRQGTVRRLDNSKMSYGEDSRCR